MGYYTDFALCVAVDANASLLGDSRRQEIMKHILKLGEDDNSCFGIFAFSIKEELDHGQKYDQWSGQESCKWYGHDQDMMELSLQFTDVIFMLHGKGEEDEDLWNKYYLNGRMQFCPAEIEVTYPSFDITQLKQIEGRES